MSNNDYWYVKDFYKLKDRKLITKFIEKNYEQVEPKEWTATDKNKVSVKNTKTLIIKWGQIKNIVGNLDSVINFLNERNLAYHLFPFNDLNNCLFNISYIYI